MIKRFFTYIFTILLLAACSDDEKYTVEPMGDDDTITFSISIPEPEKVVSRSEKEDEADERKINDLSVLIYKADGSLLQSELNIKAKDFISGPTGDNSTTKITVKLDNDAKAYSGEATVYIIANAGALLDATNTATVTNLRAVTTSATLPATDGFIMSGIVTGKLTSASLLTNKVTLYRTAAKFTIASAVGASGSSPATGASSFTPESAALYNGATAGYVIAGAEKDLYAQSTEGSAKFNDNLLLYTYPCKSSESTNTCLVVGGKYKGIDDFVYYRIDLTENETGNRLDINPNHWYEVEIKSVNSQGYPTADEAARHPSDIEVEIKDHAPTVLDMAFDGIRELGVTDSIIKKEGTNTYPLTVKYYSDIAEEMNTIPTIKSDVNWITISATGTAQPDDNGGKVVEYTVTFTEDATELGLGTLEGAITVTWQGLERKTAVEWVRPFDGKSICSTTTLTITPTDGTGNKVITDYWTFLSGTGTETTAAGVSPKLFGAQPDDMGGKVRNAGFHFPVMYGKDRKPWTYTYEVVTKIANADYTVTASISDDLKNYVTCKGNSDGTYYSFKLEWTGTQDYSYLTGQLTLKITPKTLREGVRMPSSYEFALYHTGFFHYDTGKGSEYLNGSKDPTQITYYVGSHDDGYYYYEVLPVAGTAGSTATTRYILDRNLGAKAAGMYIETADGTSYVNSGVWPFNRGKDSAGGYYKVAYKGDNFAGPQMYDGVCPPGYRVPQQRMWDAIRNSGKFTTAQAQASASYFRAEYKTTLDVERNGVTEKETIYFPKSRYMENGSMTGDANAGYYWSQTEAAGTEKYEIGRWLKSLQITGEVTSYINGNVETYGMSVRPINDITDNANYNVISFNVKGATHVFLYSGDTKDRNYTTSWPGHAIGNSDTADKQFFNFVYESTIYSAANLKVIFNYVDASGKITTISQNGIDGLHNDDTWAQGWAVSTLDKYIKCDKDKSTSHIWVGNDNNENNMRQL